MPATRTRLPIKAVAPRSAQISQAAKAWPRTAMMSSGKRIESKDEALRFCDLELTGFRA